MKVPTQLLAFVAASFSINSVKAADATQYIGQAAYASNSCEGDAISIYYTEAEDKTTCANVNSDCKDGVKNFCTTSATLQEKTQEYIKGRSIAFETYQFANAGCKNNPGAVFVVPYTPDQCMKIDESSCKVEVNEAGTEIIQECYSTDKCENTPKSSFTFKKDECFSEILKAYVIEESAEGKTSENTFTLIYEKLILKVFFDLGTNSSTKSSSLAITMASTIALVATGALTWML
jgi:hypothetical protein